MRKQEGEAKGKAAKGKGQGRKALTPRERLFEACLSQIEDHPHPSDGLLQTCVELLPAAVEPEATLREEVETLRRQLHQLSVNSQGRGMAHLRGVARR
jgi:hypothetical protein